MRPKQRFPPPYGHETQHTAMKTTYSSEVTCFPSPCLHNPIIPTRPSSCNDATTYEHSIHLPTQR